jgi:hypothetical protein
MTFFNISRLIFLLIVTIKSNNSWNLMLSISREVTFCFEKLSFLRKDSLKLSKKDQM